MTYDPNNQDTAQIESTLAELDAARETASPDYLEPDEAAGLAQIDEDEAQGPEDEAEQENTGDIRALQRRGMTTFTGRQTLHLMHRATKRGKKKTAKAVARTTAKRPPVQQQVRLTKAEQTMNESWQKKGVQYLVQEGFYYYAVPIEMDVEGEAKALAWAHLRAGKYVLFDKAVGDTIKLFGKDVDIDLRTTNYSRPSKKAAASYHGQDMVIKGISMRDTGFRVQYSEKDIPPGLDPIKGALTGDGWVYDDSRLLLPGEIYHDFSQRNALYDALREASILFFKYERVRVGGSETSNSVPIKPLADIPDDDTSEIKLTRTSGGMRMPVRDGFVISEQPEASPYGAFTAYIEVFRDVVVPIKAVDLGAGPVKPAKLALFVQLNLFGVAWTAATAA
jgi:hypothetical protein